jgi:hypothetical protein
VPGSNLPNPNVSSPIFSSVLAIHLSASADRTRRGSRCRRPTGDFSPLSSFPTIPNPLFPGLGGPVIEAVPTGIAYSDRQLLVTLFRGAPFAPGK